MSLFAKLLSLIVICVSYMDTSIAATAASKGFLVNHFSIDIPHGYIVKDVTPAMADFQLIEIRLAGRKGHKVSMYFGNAPSSPMYDWIDVTPETELNKSPLNWHRYRERDGSLEGVRSFTGLSYRGTSQSPYTKIHYFGKGINRRTAKQFEAMVASIKVVRPNLP